MEKRGQLDNSIQILERDIQKETQDLSHKEGQLRQAEVDKLSLSEGIKKFEADIKQKETEIQRDRQEIINSRRKTVETERAHEKLKREIDDLKKELAAKQLEIKRITDSFNTRMENSGIKIKK